MGVLLDTHALLWWLTDDARLSPTARQTIGDPAIEIVVSADAALAVPAWRVIG